MQAHHTSEHYSTQHTFMSITFGEDTKLSPTVAEAALSFTLLPSQRLAL